MEKKQTAVEWLSEHLCNEMNFDYWKAVEKAKQMEKEQMKDLYLSHVTKATRLREIFEKQFEELYNETFGETKN